MESARASRRLSGWALVVAAALAAGCGSAAKPAPVQPEPSEQAKACRAYNARITPFLKRFDGALGDLQAGQQAAGDDGTANTEAIARFAEILAGELPELRKIDSRDDPLAAAHRQLVVAVEEVGLGHEQLATAIAIGDRDVRKRSLDRLAGGWRLWSEASRFIVDRCREDGGEE